MLAEDEILADVLANVNGDDCVVNIGSYIRTFTCFIQNSLSDHGQLVAFEPNPINYTSLVPNVGLNGSSAEGYCLAISDENSVVDISIPTTDISTISSIDATSRDSVTVPSQTGDSFFSARDVTPTIVKIDVEGAEVKVLEGMREILTHPDCRLVYCEVHLVSLPDQGGHPDEVENLLEQYGYECEILSRKEDKTYHVKAAKTTRGDF